MNDVNMKQQLEAVINGLASARTYISEDLECICDDTMANYANSALSDVRQAAKTARKLYSQLDSITRYLDVLSTLSMDAGYHNIFFSSDEERLNTLRSWTAEFVQRYSGSQWQNADFYALVGEFAVEKRLEWMKSHPAARSAECHTVSIVLGEEACRRYDQGVDCGIWVGADTLADFGAVTTRSFGTSSELDAYVMGVEDTAGYLEARRMMTCDEWAAYLEENKDVFSDADVDDSDD